MCNVVARRCDTNRQRTHTHTNFGSHLISSYRFMFFFFILSFSLFAIVLSRLLGQLSQTSDSIGFSLSLSFSALRVINSNGKLHRICKHFAWKMLTHLAHLSNSNAIYRGNFNMESLTFSLFVSFHPFIFFFLSSSPSHLLLYRRRNERMLNGAESWEKFNIFLSAICANLSMWLSLNARDWFLMWLSEENSQIGSLTFKWN